MLPTSGTYNFQSVEVELLIREAFERIGLLGDFVEPVKLDSARRSINLILLEWMSKSINLWTLKNGNLTLVKGQHQYTLPDTVSDITQINLKTLGSGGRVRILDGTPASDPGGTAENAFDGNPATACTQTGPGGSISYDYGDGVTRQITSVGIQSNATGPLELSISVSDDGVIYNVLLDIPDRIYTEGENVIFDILVPVDARFYAIGGGVADTLDIQEFYLYEDSPVVPDSVEYTISPVSRYEYFTYPNKNVEGRPSSYYFDRQTPASLLNVWPAPNGQYNNLVYSYRQVMEDVGLYTNTIEIPPTFYSALIWGLSWHLATKFNPEAAAMLKGEYEQAFATATEEDSENTPITIMADNSYYRE